MPGIKLTPVIIAKPDIWYLCIPSLPDLWHHHDCGVPADRTPDDHTQCTGLEQCLHSNAGTGHRGQNQFLVHAQIPFGILATCGISLKSFHPLITALIADDVEYVMTVDQTCVFSRYSKSTADAAHRIRSFIALPR